jgi:hypothetical protein
LAFSTIAANCAPFGVIVPVARLGVADDVVDDDDDGGLISFVR